MPSPSPHVAALRALRVPFESGTLAWPGDGALFLDAQPGWLWRIDAAVQNARPVADALAREGHRVLAPGEAPPRDAPMVLLLPQRQRAQARASMAAAFAHCAPGGLVVAGVANDAGARSAEADFSRIGGLDGTLAKHHCRVFWARNDAARVDAALRDAWLALDAPRAIDAPALPRGGFTSRPGVFAWDRIDPASSLLAAHLPEGLTGDAADLGAGWGYLSLELLRRHSGLRTLDVIESDARALALARTNLDGIAPGVALDFLWHDATAGLPRAYDVVVTNPPFHAHDRADRPELGQAFIAAAAAALRPRGRLFLVANRHLPYEAVLSARFGEVRVLAQAHGFKAIEAVRGAR